MCAHCISANRPRNVLDALLAQIVENAIELVAYLVAHDPADTDPARLSQAFKTRGHVHPIAEDVFALGYHVPRLIPARNSIRFSGEVSAFLSARPRWNSTAQRTASTTLGNSTNSPSPVVLTIRPLCSATLGWTSSWKWAWSRSCVPSSSAPIKRE